METKKLPWLQCLMLVYVILLSLFFPCSARKVGRRANQKEVFYKKHIILMFTFIKLKKQSSKDGGEDIRSHVVK